MCKESMTTTSSKFPSISKHNHCNDTDEPCDIYQEYADDLSAITTGKKKIDHIKKTLRSESETRNFHMNKKITEE